MRALVSAALVAGCYAPKAPAGAPCDLDSPACPAGQTCVAPGVCSAGLLLPDAAPDVSAIDAPPDAPLSFLYPASIAKCINPMATPPDPSACATSAGTHAIRIDAVDLMHPWDGFLRFDLDNQVAGRTIIAVSLVLTATDTTNSSSNNSGLVYESTPFTASDLTMAEPAKAQATAIGTSQGAVAKLQTIAWSLPRRLVTPGGSVYLELETPSSDGVFYFDDLGTSPPQLRIDVQ